MVPTMRDSTGTTCSHAPHTYAWYQPWETAQARLAHMHHTYAWYQQYENSFSLQSTVGLVFYATLKNCLDCIHTSNRAGSWWALWKSAKHWWRPWEHGTGALELQYRRHNLKQKIRKIKCTAVTGAENFQTIEIPGCFKITRGHSPYFFLYSIQ